MATSHGCCEIVEANEELDIQPKMSGKECLPQQGHVYSIEDDINRLFQAIDIKTSVGGDTLHKNPMKRPMRGNAPQVSGIGISESVNLKQALRRLCLSQASEIAAMKRRSLRSAVASSPVSNGGAMKRLYRAVVVEANDSGESVNEDKRNIVEISLPGKVMRNHYAEGPASTNVSCSGSSNQGSRSSAVFPGSAAIKAKMMRAPSPDKVVPLPSDAVDDLPNEESERERKLKLMQSKHGVCTIKKVLEEGDIFPNKEMLKKSVQEAKQLNDALHPESYPNSSTNCNKMKKSLSNSPQLGTPVFRNKNFIKKKTKLVSMSDSSASVPGKGNSSSNLLNSAAKLVVSQTEESATDAGTKAINRLSSTFSGESIRVGVSLTEPIVSELDILKVGDGASVSTLKTDGKAKLREKGEISQSSKSSIGDYSCSTSNSGASSLSGSSCWGNRPHMSKDLRWDVVQRIQKQHGNLNLKHFQLLKRLGSGDIGTVYLAELVSTSCMFALKVMDNEFLTRRKKLLRAQTEREILQMLDHPFLPTLYAHFATDKLSCLVMDYCPGGDLHVLRQRQPCRSFSEHSARFYVAEVLLALEYLHMLGVVYRDLKPENVLVREDGHIMLSDFDLSLRCIVNPTIYRSSSPNLHPPKKVSSPCLESSCIDPFCLQPSWQVSCFTPRLLTSASKSRKVKADQHVQGVALPQLVAEPTDARSNSFVGTHEYLAPEIVKGEGHGSSVDWWTFGIFLYELLYGKTPFKGSNNEETLANVVSQPLKFPASPIVSFHARNLIRGLLIKEPENRLGSLKGAAEIKQHPFFEGLNWALIRCAQPPERPRLYDIGVGGDPSAVSHKSRSGKSLECNSDRIEFELF